MTTPPPIFETFIANLQIRLRQSIETELNEIRLRDLEEWLKLHDYLESLIETPSVGTMAQRMQVTKMKLAFVNHEVEKELPNLIIRFFTETGNHYRLHHQDLKLAIGRFSLKPEDTGKAIEDLLRQIQTPPPPEP